MGYARTLQYIDSFINFEKIPKYDYGSSFKLERMSSFLEQLGDPHKGLKAIHISGSKGKGSACAVLAYILKEAGYSVGLYTSPHLVDMRERIRVLGEGSRVKSGGFEGKIEKEDLVGLIEKIKPAAEGFRDHERFGRLSFFEILTAAAFLYFKKMQVDIAVLETGLGGRLDATNVIQPIACGITNISMEHADKLGDTLGAIAMEKAGIIKAKSAKRKAQSIVISAQQEKEVEEVIREKCRHKRANLYEIGKDINYSIVKSDEKSQVFNLDGPGYSYKDLELNLIGAHQVENASLAIGIAKAIEKNGFSVDEEAIRAGLKKVSWPGRLQVVQRDPYVILDGAQNVASIKAVLSSTEQVFSYNNLICIFGISSDKDIKGMAKELARVCDRIILTRSQNPRAVDPLALGDNFPNPRPGLEFSKDLTEAMQKALKIADKGDLILVTGSLFLVAEALKFTNPAMQEL